MDQPVNTPAQTLSNPTPRAMSNGSSGIQVEGFDGSKARYRMFMRQVLLLFAAENERFQTDAQKIYFILNRMSTGYAEEWANARMDRIIEENNAGTWIDFHRDLTTEFSDANETNKALGQLRALRQSGKSAHEFFTEFDFLFRQAKLTVLNHESILIDMLKQGLNGPLVEKIYAGEHFPVTYDNWKNKAIWLDDLWQEYKLLRRSKAPPTRTTVTQPGNRTPAAAPAPPTHDPMVVDRNQPTSAPFICYNCNGAGHMSRNCPMPPRPCMQKVRAVEAKEDKPLPSTPNITIEQRPKPVSKEELEEDLARLKDMVELKEKALKDFVTGKD
jgi:hypothetical protein